MKVDEIIFNILLIPSKFYKLGNTSIVTLLKESGYFEIHNQINNDNIKEALYKHKEYINDWTILSESRRNDSGYYINLNDDGKYIVGYLLNDKNFKQFEFWEIVDAYAVFIKQYIEEIGKQI